VEFKNTTISFLFVLVHVENVLQKSEKNPMSFFSVLDVPLHGEFQNTKNYLSDKISKKLPKTGHPRTYPPTWAFFLGFPAPLGHVCTVCGAPISDL
jgi:hypothetical protein